MIIKYAEIFNCSPCYIMGWENDTDLTLSSKEEKIIKTYRTADTLTQNMVLRVLDIDKDKDNKKIQAV